MFFRMIFSTYVQQCHHNCRAAIFFSFERTYVLLRHHLGGKVKWKWQALFQRITLMSLKKDLLQKCMCIYSSNKLRKWKKKNKNRKEIQNFIAQVNVVMGLLDCLNTKKRFSQGRFLFSLTIKWFTIKKILQR